MEITIANLGRSTKTAEIIRSASVQFRSGQFRFGRSGSARTWSDLNARPRPLQPFKNHRLALFQPTGDDSQRGSRLAQLDRAAFHLVIGANDEDVGAALVRHDSGTRDIQRGD